MVEKMELSKLGSDFGTLLIPENNAWLRSCAFILSESATSRTRDSLRKVLPAHKNTAWSPLESPN